MVDLRAGVAPEEAAQALRQSLSLLADARSVMQGLISRGQIEQARDRYLAWTEDAERQLRGFTVQDTLSQGLFTQRHSDIRSLRSDSPRPWPLLDGEAHYQADRLDDCLAIAASDSLAVDADPTTRLVLDTNVWLHFQTFDAVWPTLVAEDAVRLVVPLVVLRELDDHKNRGGTVAARRARKIGPRLLALTADAATGLLRPGVTLTLQSDPPDHNPRAHNDIELLDTVQRIAQACAARVVLVSDDSGVHVSARGRGLEVMHPPVEWRLPDSDETSRENAQLKDRLAAQEASTPQIRLVFQHNNESHAQPKPSRAVHRTVEAEIAQAERDLPLRPEDPYRLTVEVLEMSDERRRRWHRAVGQWAARRDQMQYARNAGHRLDLAALNTGGTAASNVEIVLRAPDGYDLKVKRDMTSPERPREPERFPGVDPIDFDQPVWTSIGSKATAHMDLIRQGGSQRLIGEPIWIVRSDGAPIQEGVAINWVAVGVSPPLQASGELHVSPRPTVQSP